ERGAAAPDRVRAARRYTRGGRGARVSGGVPARRAFALGARQRRRRARRAVPEPPERPVLRPRPALQRRPFRAAVARLTAAVAVTHERPLPHNLRAPT